MFAVLGDIEFELIAYWDGFEAQFGADYAEHARIEGKPGLQFIGEKLDEISISLVFNQMFCTPDVELARLRNLLRSHQAQALVFGNGDYRGWFVLTQVRATSEQTDKSGNVLALTAEVTLREYVGDPKNPLVAPAVNTGVPNSQTVATATAAASGIASAIRTAVGYVRTAQSVVKNVSAVVQTVQKIKNNPSQALGQVPTLLTQIGTAVEPLQKAVPALAAVTATFPEVSRVAKAADQAITFVKSAHTALSGISVSNIDDLSPALDVVATQLSAAGDTLEKVAPVVSSLTAAITTRRI
ncbi:phage tail protein [Lonsdalea quercina]|uniref:phage tail protein n=1 Tax=Lonsdalea quercina TaxID=71657 RepID=UPI0039768524